MDNLPGIHEIECLQCHDLKVVAIMTARLLDQTGMANNARNESAVHLSVYTRVDKKARTYVQSQKKKWSRILFYIF